jgi:hypothetical protein
VPGDRSLSERFRRPAITVVHRYDFGADAALVGHDLGRPEAWDALRTRTTGPFALPPTAEQLRRTAREDEALVARAATISRWLDGEGITSVASYGVGVGRLEVLLREARPDRELILTEYAPANVERLRELLPGVDVRRHDLLAEPPLDAELHLMHRIDTELSNAQWRRVLHGFAAERILWLAAGLAGPRQLALQLLAPRRPRRRTRAGLLRTEAAFESLWAATHRAQTVDAGDLRAWALEPRR